MSDTEQVVCPECGDTVPVTKTGRLRKHPHEGETCSGSGQPAPESAVEEWPDDDSDEPTLSVGQDAVNTTDVPERVLPPVAPAPAPKPTLEGFVHRVRVKAPCPYLEDTSWHAGNQAMAAKAAAAAGRTVTGEASYRGADYSWDGRRIVLTYTVPVR